MLFTSLDTSPNSRRELRWPSMSLAELCMTRAFSRSSTTCFNKLLIRFAAAT